MGSLLPPRPEHRVLYKILPQPIKDDKRDSGTYQLRDQLHLSHLVLHTTFLTSLEFHWLALIDLPYHNECSTIDVEQVFS